MKTYLEEIKIIIFIILAEPRFLPRKAVVCVDRVSFVQVRGGANHVSPFYLADKVEMNFNTFKGTLSQDKQKTFYVAVPLTELSAY